MVPCVQLSHIELGRINRDSLREVWQQHPEMQRLRVRDRIPLSNFAFCQGCEYIPYCRGGCPAIAYNLVGRDDYPSPDSCLRLFLREGGKLPVVAAPVLMH
jgi:radical SAM protein with 4Fe4S-binding SPASM domain